MMYLNLFIVFAWFLAFSVGIMIGYRHAWIFDDLKSYFTKLNSNYRPYSLTELISSSRKKGIKPPCLDREDTFDIKQWRPVSNIPIDSFKDGPTVVSSIPDYSVSGTPRHIPWSIRKREREAAAKTKRRQFESFREEA